mmetsp:Transcript_20317/g.50787  ORF Transcript_20317/g.50787 Transcript_20317/m.50787 type:complete len:200 (+) Transcript_20317:580-1179(+)
MHLDGLALRERRPEAVDRHILAELHLVTAGVDLDVVRDRGFAHQRAGRHRHFEFAREPQAMRPRVVLDCCAVGQDGGGQLLVNLVGLHRRSWRRLGDLIEVPHDVLGLQVSCLASLDGLELRCLAGVLSLHQAEPGNHRDAQDDHNEDRNDEASRSCSGPAFRVVQRRDQFRVLSRASRRHCRDILFVDDLFLRRFSRD